MSKRVRMTGLIDARRAGLYACAAALVAVLLTPFMVAVWGYDSGDAWDDLMPLERSVGPRLESWGVLDFGSGDLPYHIYGKAFFLVYLLAIPLIRRVEPSRATVAYWSWRVMLTALTVATIGDFTAYWIMSIPGPPGHVGASLGFTIELLALPALLLASVVYGASSLRYKLLPIWAAVLLIATLPAGVLTLAFVTNYLPNAPVLPWSLAWATIGGWHLFRDEKSIDMHSSASPQYAGGAIGTEL